MNDNNSNKPLLGFCPIGKFVFSHEDALRWKSELERKFDAMGINYVGIDDAVTDGMVRGTDDIAPAIKRLKEAGANALFMPHCNFGTEHAVALIGRDMAVPTLVWGPRDEAPLADGTRLRDTLCGLFASTKVLRKLNVPYKYIENTSINDPIFEKGLDSFMRSANVADAFNNGIKIGHIGQRIDFFWTTIINESELLERFKVEVLPLDMLDFVGACKSRVSSNTTEYKDRVEEWKKQCDITGFTDETPLMNILAVADQIQFLTKENQLDGIAIQSFMSLVDAMGAYCMHASGIVSENTPLAEESDIHGTISNIMLQRASYGETTYLTEYTNRHPENDNAVLLWHAGAPPSMCHPDVKAKIGNHWILPSPLSGMSHFQMKDGNLTLARFDGDHGEYQLAVGKGKTIPGPETLNNYLWCEVDDWPRWEHKLMNGPFIHHTGMVYGDYA
ncbi:MAG: hypothetical protein KAG97_01020, partial [Victivallales bacterium]|nr:hypothetical protein [Victivallales bacterium]